MFDDLTDEQLAHLTLAANKSRREGKKWLHNRKMPCDSPSLDAALAVAAGRVGVASKLRAEERKRQAIQDDADRQASAKMAWAVHLAASGRWLHALDVVSQLEPVEVDREVWSEEQARVIWGWAEPHPDAVVAEVDSGSVDFDPGEPLSELFRGVRHELVCAWQQAAERDALRRIEGQARPGGRFRVYTIYRKHGTPKKSPLCFDRRDVAEDYMALNPDDGTSSYRLELFDAQETEETEVLRG